MCIARLANVRQIQSLWIQAMEVIIRDVARAGMIRDASELHKKGERMIRKVRGDSLYTWYSPHSPAPPSR